MGLICFLAAADLDREAFYFGWGGAGFLATSFLGGDLGLLMTATLLERVLRGEGEVVFWTLAGAGLFWVRWEALTDLAAGALELDLLGLDLEADFLVLEVDFLVLEADFLVVDFFAEAFTTGCSTTDLTTDAMA